MAHTVMTPPRDTKPMERAIGSMWYGIDLAAVDTDVLKVEIQPAVNRHPWFEAARNDVSVTEHHRNAVELLLTGIRDSLGTGSGAAFKEIQDRISALENTLRVFGFTPRPAESLAGSRPK